MTSPSLRDTLRTRLTSALKDRDRASASTVRQALAAIDNAEAVPVETLPRAGAIEGSAVGLGAADAARRQLTEAEILALVCAEQLSHLEAAAAVESHAPERAEEHRRAAALLGSLLPGSTA